MVRKRPVSVRATAHEGGRCRGSLRSYGIVEVVGLKRGGAGTIGNEQTVSEQRTSNPASTGGAGTFFEQHVDAYWLAQLLVGCIPPILIDTVVAEVHFQTERLGWSRRWTRSCIAATLIRRAAIVRAAFSGGNVVNRRNRATNRSISSVSFASGAAER